MLSDRHYMRDSYPRTGRSALSWLLSAIAAGFIINSFFFSWLNHSTIFQNAFALSLSGISQWKLWQLVTYSVIHQAGDAIYVLVVAFNLVCLYLLGRDLEPLLGTKKFLLLYFGGVVLGAFVWLGVHIPYGGLAVGAWPGVAALFTFYACLNANQRIPILLFFVVPVTIKPKYLALIASALALCGLAFWEIRGEHAPLGLNYSAHLGGMLAGILFYRLVHLRDWLTPDGRAEIELPQWLRKIPKIAAPNPPKSKLTPTTRDDLRAEVDRILDKINSQGLASLTTEEKRLLDEAKDMIGRR